MSNDTTTRPCIATTATGRSCAEHVLKDAPVALCYDHTFLVYMYMHGSISSHHKSIYKAMERIEKGPSKEEIALDQAWKEQSQVYYIRIGDYIKIGYTQNLKQRISGLRVDKSDVLATEPGGQAKERERHLQFANIRIGQRENFERTADLLTHIAKVRRENGPPKMTGFVSQKAA